MLKRGLWYGILIIAAISLFFITSGFINAVKFTTGEVEEVNQPTVQDSSTLDNNKIGDKDMNKMHILIMGDSIGRGTGDEKAKGIGGYLTEFLKNQTSKDIAIDNAAIDGYKIGDLLGQIKSGKLDNAIKTADFIILSIGGNDLREIQSLKDVAKEEAFKDKQKNYVEALREVYKNIRLKNKNTMIISVGLYNPYGLEGPSDNSRLLSIWNYNTQIIVEEDIRSVFIPTYDLFKYNQEYFISSDKLHPNSAGYQTIAYLISKAIERVVMKK